MTRDLTYTGMGRFIDGWKLFFLPSPPKDKRKREGRGDGVFFSEDFVLRNRLPN
jgi:hypothetical protein